MRAFLAVASLSIATIVMAQSVQPQTKPKEGPEVPAAEQRGSEKNPLAVKILPAPDAEAQADKQEKHRQEKAREDWWLSNATIWLAAVTTALAIFTALLWRATYKLVTEAKDTAKRQLRAYVFFKPELPIKVPILDNWHTDGMRFHILNNGQTPAYELAQLMFVGIRPKPLKEALVFSEPNAHASRFVLNPGLHSEFKLQTDAAIPPAQMALIRAGTHAMFIWGQANYRDTFGQPRWSRLAMEVDGEGEGARINWCPKGNEAN